MKVFGAKSLFYWNASHFFWLKKKLFILFIYLFFGGVSAIEFKNEIEIAVGWVVSSFFAHCFGINIWWCNKKGNIKQIPPTHSSFAFSLFDNCYLSITFRSWLFFVCCCYFQANIKYTHILMVLFLFFFSPNQQKSHKIVRIGAIKWINAIKYTENMHCPARFASFHWTFLYTFWLCINIFYFMVFDSLFSYFLFIFLNFHWESNANSTA